MAVADSSSLSLAESTLGDLLVDEAPQRLICDKIYNFDYRSNSCSMSRVLSLLFLTSAIVRNLSQDDREPHRYERRGRLNVSLPGYKTIVIFRPDLTTNSPTMQDLFISVLSTSSYIAILGITPTLDKVRIRSLGYLFTRFLLTNQRYLTRL